MTGTGAQTDPYIVSTWAEFESVATQRNVYIKFTDNTVIDTVGLTGAYYGVSYSGKVKVYAKEVDFNGLVVKNMNVYGYDLNGQYANNTDVLQFGAVVYDSKNYTVLYKNLTIEHLNLATNRDVLFLNGTFENCYFYDINAPSMPENNVFATSITLRRSALYVVATSYGLYNCILQFNSENICFRIPGNSYYNCEIEYNYTYTLKNATPELDSLISQDSKFDNCLVYGTIKLEGSGELAVYAESGSLGVGRIQAFNTIFNFKTITNDTSTLIEGQNCWLTSDTNILFVTNNGNNEGFSTISKDKAILLGDLRNSDILRDRGFSFIEDDEVRYPQYGNDNKSQDWTFRKNTLVNDSMPFLPFWKYPTPVKPIYEGEVYQHEYICIYDMETPQDGFNNHGLAVLTPTSCRVTENLNGNYNLMLEHPRDTDGKWQFIMEMNIIKCLGQLFVIQTVDDVETANSGRVTAYAEHISYTLNDLWLFPGSSVAGYLGQTLIDSIIEQATDMGGDWQTKYTFNISTDLDVPENFRDWYEMKEGHTPYEMILGSDGFVAKIGGEIYRDNFNISINDRMEGAQENAFEMSIGHNLKGIRRTVDLSTFCTYFRGYDVSDGNFGTWFAVSWDPSTLPRAYPRNVVRSQNFYYDKPEYADGQLERDTMAFFNANCAPLVSYVLTLKDLKDNPDFKMFTNNYRYKVGDSGRVWDERLKSWLTLRITKTLKNGITGETLEVTIGSTRSFTRPFGYSPVIPHTAVIIPNAEKEIEGKPPLTFITDAFNLSDWTIYGNETGVGDLQDDKYIIKIVVSNNAEESKTVTIPRDKPLMSGESISMGDTGISIPTYDGVNTISIDCKVQPSKIRIKYKEKV